jgi:hypothetical protein
VPSASSSPGEDSGSPNASRRGTRGTLRSNSDSPDSPKKTTRENTQAQLEQSHTELDITRRGQITERFTQAIDQLGSESLEIRLGGIYSLERTAREDRDYHWPIMEVLTTYVRTQTWPIMEVLINLPQSAGGTPSLELLDTDSMELPDTDPRIPPSPKPDIQAILTVIARRAVYHRDVEYGPIDLHTTYLRNAKLSGANLQGANLQGADLVFADLKGADLRGAKLSKGAIRSPAYLAAADLKGADLRGADLTQKQLEGTTGDQTTRLPDHLKPPAHWGLKTDEQNEGD